jgi:hypothetical protein
MRSFLIAVAALALPAGAFAQPASPTTGPTPCVARGGPEVTAARADEDKAYKAALKKKGLTPAAAPTERTSWSDQVAPPGDTGALVKRKLGGKTRRAVVIGWGNAGQPPPADFVTDKKGRLFLVIRQVHATSQKTVIVCGCSHGGARMVGATHGLLLPDGVDYAGTVTIAYDAPQVYEEDPPECGMVP